MTDEEWIGHYLTRAERAEAQLAAATAERDRLAAQLEAVKELCNAWRQIRPPASYMMLIEAIGAVLGPQSGPIPLEDS